MEYHFEATEDFLRRQNEIQILLRTAEEKNDEKDTFLKLAVVSLVTKFQVFVESILKEFLYLIRQHEVKYSKLPIYMRLNSIKLGLNDNALVKLAKHDKLNDDTGEKIKDYVMSIGGMLNNEFAADENLKMRVSYPLGRTGKDELLSLFKQIEGNSNIFIDSESGEENIDLNQLDSLLLTRHLIIHQDRFNQTDNKIIEYVNYINNIAIYCDSYLKNKLKSFGVEMERKEWTTAR